MNLSQVSDADTATTAVEPARQRALHLACLGVKRVLELCVGPSLRVLEAVYGQHGIEVVGNDIDGRWRRFYPAGQWLMGDALAIDYTGFDAVVFAPPLSHGCSGRREDALQISQVTPSYSAFLKRWDNSTTYAVLVLPGRSLATKYDRREYHRLLQQAEHKGQVSPIALTDGRRKIRKYIDLYIVPF